MSSMAATAAGRLSVAVSSLVVSKAAPAEGSPGSQSCSSIRKGSRLVVPLPAARISTVARSFNSVGTLLAGVRNVVDELKIPRT